MVEVAASSSSHACIPLGAAFAVSQPEVGFDDDYSSAHSWWNDVLTALAIAVFVIVVWRVLPFCLHSTWLGEHARLVRFGWPTVMVGFASFIEWPALAYAAPDSWSTVLDLLEFGFVLANVPVGLAVALITWPVAKLVGLDRIPTWVFVFLFWVFWYFTIKHLQGRDWSDDTPYLSIGQGHNPQSGEDNAVGAISD